MILKHTGFRALVVRVPLTDHGVWEVVVIADLDLRVSRIVSDGR